MVTLVPSSKADLWTKNRINNRGPEFLVLGTGHPKCWGGRKALHVREARGDWEGWFPAENVVIVE